MRAVTTMSRSAVLGRCVAPPAPAAVYKPMEMERRLAKGLVEFSVRQKTGGFISRGPTHPLLFSILSTVPDTELSQCVIAFLVLRTARFACFKPFRTGVFQKLTDVGEVTTTIRGRQLQ